MRRRDWHPDELIEHWSLTPCEKQQALSKRAPSRLGFAVLLKYFQHQGRFPKSAREVPKPVVDYLTSQLGVASAAWQGYDWQGRTIKYHRDEIRKLLGFREATVADGQELINWLCDQCLPHTRRFEHIESAAYERLRAAHDRATDAGTSRSSLRHRYIDASVSNPRPSNCHRLDNG
jgi:hypothetical protein